MYVIDANVYVSGIRPQEAFHIESREFLREVRARQPVVTCPEILVPEVAGALGRGTEGSLYAARYARQLRKLPSHQFFAVDDELATRAATFGAVYGLHGMDAIYAALASRETARLVTLDDDLLDQALAGVVHAVTPSDELATLRAQTTSP